MNTPNSEGVTNGQGTWDPFALNYAAKELAREFPHAELPRIELAATAAAQLVKPEEGRVLLLQKARERLGAG